MRYLILLALASTFACVHKSADRVVEPAAIMNFAEEKVSIHAFWQSAPTVEPEQFLRLEVRDGESGKLIKAPKDLSVSVWTKTHSYGLVEPTVVAVTDENGKEIDGLYDVSGIFFLAKGKWEVRVYMDEGREKNPMEKFLVDLGDEALNPIDDPNSAMYKMMKKTGMDHKNMDHGKMNHETQVDDKKPATESKGERKSGT